MPMFQFWGMSRSFETLHVAMLSGISDVRRMVKFRVCMVLWFSHWPKIAYEISGWQYISTWMVPSDSGLLVNLTSWPSILWKRPWTPKVPRFVVSAGLSCRLAVRRFLLQFVNDGSCYVLSTYTASRFWIDLRIERAHKFYVRQIFFVTCLMLGFGPGRSSDHNIQLVRVPFQCCEQFVMIYQNIFLGGTNDWWGKWNGFSQLHPQDHSGIMFTTGNAVGRHGWQAGGMWPLSMELSEKERIGLDHLRSFICF